MREFHLTAILVLSTLISTSCVRNTSPINKLSVAKSSALVTAIDSVMIPLDTNCHINGPVIAEAKDWEGYVYFLGTTKLYSITYTVPNSVDSQWIGYVCNMPNEFKRGGLKVTFSGKYYHAYKYVKHLGIDGHPQFYLQLEKISLQ